MGMQVVSGAMLQCSFGTAPGTLTVLPVARVNSNKQPAATINDHLPGVNIAPFGMCNCPANPAVAVATTAAFGVLTPQPCMPVTTAPWIPGVPTVMIGNKPALNDSCMLMCMWGGVITIKNAGQTNHNVP
ncbi:MAG: DUF4280 domain-containing protein [Deltaproteobacteria bacterium]|nr:DUF4280 domain-containing protein [Deltaproteobacteria bacterium]